MNEREREAIKRLREYHKAVAEWDGGCALPREPDHLESIVALDAMLAECEQAKRDAVTMFRDASGLARYEDARVARARCIQYQRDLQAAGGGDGDG